MKKITTILVMVLMALALTGCGNKGYIRDLEKKVKDREEKIAELEQQMADLDKEKIAALSERDYYKIEFDKSKTELDKSNSTIEKLEAELSGKDESNEEVSYTPATYVIDNSFSSFYVGTVFYPDPDGRLYHSDVKWYSNPLCIQGTEVKTDVVIISPVTKNDTYNNGFKFYTCMSTNGLVYASKDPCITYK